jgi:LytS/YehU family sensor histidine kinase
MDEAISVFDYHENDITIHFGCLDLSNDFVNGFEYKMLNDTVWNYLSNQHLLSFSQLSAGQYHLQLRKKNDPNKQRYIETQWVIKPPFWLTWWFLSLIFIALSVLLYGLIKRRINAIKEQARMKHKLAETEMMALRAQMNPHFIFNCISSIDNFILDNDKDNASAWLNKFAKLIRSVLDNSRNEVIPFWKDWETLRLYLELEQLRSDGKFTFTMTADPELLEGHYRIPPLIAQPFIENAIHHGLLPRLDRNGKLAISAFLINHHLHFTVEDNGIGREKAEALKAINRLDHNSYGLKMSRDRIDLFNMQQKDALLIEDLTDAQGNATGTKVEIILIV